jgi:GNAT superfamily N-acetyltransferase
MADPGAGSSNQTRPAAPADAGRLVELMDEFYAEAGYTLDKAHARRAFEALLADPGLGRVWLIQAGSTEVGYVALTLVYSMEHGGPAVVVEDLFVQAPYRNAGRGKAAMTAVRTFCAHAGIRAVSVQVGRDNAVAQSVYRDAGFAAVDRQLMTLELADPTHEV